MYVCVCVCFKMDTAGAPRLVGERKESKAEE